MKKVKTSGAIGADPVINNLTFPPNKSLAGLNTLSYSGGHLVLFCILYIFALKAFYTIYLLACFIGFKTAYIIFNNLGTIGKYVGLIVLTSFKKSAVFPLPNLTCAP